MTVFGVSMIRDEVDIVGHTVRNMARQVDRLIVADNGSVDGTRELLAELAQELPLEVVDDPERGYWQSRKMTALAHRAGEQGASWVVPFDADEWWYCTFGPIREHLAGIGDGMMVARAGLYDHVPTGLDPDEANPVRRMGWRRRDTLALPKVACRYRQDLTIHQGNHGCDYGGMLPASVDLLVVRHFPYRSAAQFVSKVRNGAEAYRATDLPADVGAHWRQWGEILERDGEDAVAEVFRRWFWRADPTRPARIEGEEQRALLYDPAPGS
ncbi:MAG: glycosyltransferase family 2 protein [Porticoccaceae bacterium]